GDLLGRLQRHAAQRVLHHMQRRQCHRLLARVARHVGQDLLSQLFGQYAHGGSCKPTRCNGWAYCYLSNSAAMMFRLPSTATTSLTRCPTIRCGNRAKWMYDGGRVRALYAWPVPSLTT